MNLVMIAAAVMPALLLWLYTCKHDTRREPMSLMVRAMLYGAGISVPVIFIELAIKSLLFGAGGTPETLVGTTAEAFLVAAFPEEVMKMIALCIVLRNNPYYDEHYDGIVYAVCVGLGFAAVENIGYILGSSSWVELALMRALLSVPGHYAFAVLMGYYLSLYHFGGKSAKNLVCALLVPVLAHGCYDAIALSGKVAPAVGSLSTVLLIYFCIKMHKFARKRMMAQISKDKSFCDFENNNA